MRTIRAAIRAGHVDTGADDPTGHDGVRRVLQGLTRQAAGRGRGQADPLTADDVAAIMATASIPRRTGRGMESETAAADRGATDKAIAAVVVPRVACAGRKRRRCAGRTCSYAARMAAASWSTSAGRKPIRTGTAADVRYVKNGCARSPTKSIGAPGE